MTTYHYGASPDLVSVDAATGRPRTGVSATFFDSESAGSQDLTIVDSLAGVGGAAISGAFGRWEFTSSLAAELWLDTGTGVRWLVRAQESYGPTGPASTVPGPASTVPGPAGPSGGPVPVGGVDGQVVAKSGGGVVWADGATDASMDAKIVTERGTERAHQSSAYAHGLSVASKGAMGDGTTDDTVDIQATITAAAVFGCEVYFPTTAAFYNVTNNLYLYGKVSLIGVGASIKLTATPTHERWINVGHSTYGATASDAQRWSGVVTGLTFEVSATVSLINHLIAVADASGAKIYGNTFITNDRLQGGVIKGDNNSAYLAGTGGQRTRVSVYDNDLFCSGRATSPHAEGISFSGPASDITVHDNRLYNTTDDAIAFHGATGGSIKDNIITSYGGRIFVSDSSDIKINDNRVTYVNGVDGSVTTGGMGISVESAEGTGAYSAVCTDISVHGNRIIYPAQASAANYGIRIMGARSVQVWQNNIIDNSAYSHSITVENKTAAGWVDPTGIDTAGTARAYNISVVGNNMSGTKPAGIAVNSCRDLITVDENTAGGFSIGPDLVTWGSGNHLLGAGNFYFNENADGAQPILSVGGVAVGASVALKLPGASSTVWTCARRTRITRLAFSFPAALTSGYYWITFWKNGTNVQGAGFDTLGVKGGVVYATGDSSNTALVFAPGDTLEIKAETSAGVPTPNDIAVTCHGVYF